MKLAFIEAIVDTPISDFSVRRASTKRNLLKLFRVRRLLERPEKGWGT